MRMRFILFVCYVASIYFFSLARRESSFYYDCLFMFFTIVMQVYVTLDIRKNIIFKRNFWMLSVWLMPFLSIPVYVIRRNELMRYSNPSKT